MPPHARSRVSTVPTTSAPGSSLAAAWAAASSAKSPKAVGPDPVTRAVRAPLPRRASSDPQLGAQRQGGELQIVLGGLGQRRRRARGQRAQRAGIEVHPRGRRLACRAQPVELGVDAAVERPRSWGTSTSASSGSRNGSTTLPRARTPARARGSPGWARRCRGSPPTARRPAASSGAPAIALAARSSGGRVGAAASQAGRDRDPLLDRHPQRAGAPRRVWRRGTPAARRRRGSARPRPGRPPRRRSASFTRDLVGQVERREERAAGGAARPRGARPTCSTRLTFAGARSTTAHHREAALPRSGDAGASRDASAAKSCGASRSARTSAGCPSSTSASRATVADALGRVRREGQRPGQGLAAVGEGGVDERRNGRRGRGAGAAHPQQRGLHVGRRMEHGARDPSQHRDLAGQLRQHRGGPVGLAPGLRRQPLGHLALHHRHPQGHVRQAPRRCAAAPWPPRRRAGWPPPCRGPVAAPPGPA